MFVSWKQEHRVCPELSWVMDERSKKKRAEGVFETESWGRKGSKDPAESV